MNFTLKWHEREGDLQELADDILEQRITSSNEIRKRLDGIFGQSQPFDNIDSRCLAFLEFLFSRSRGPYSPEFGKYSEIIRVIVLRSRALRMLLDHSGAHALGNMVLHGRGRLKFIISDSNELGCVLDFWESCGLEKQTPDSVFQAILMKKGVLDRINNKDARLLARLSAVFPVFMEEFIPDQLDISPVSKPAETPFRSYYEEVIRKYQEQGKTIDDLIAMANQQDRNPLERRNSFLTYLVKKKHFFQCQICTAKNPAKKSPPVQVHHIVPLSRNGEDHSGNMIVVCDFHHRKIHEGHITVEKALSVTVCESDSDYPEKPVKTLVLDVN
jgi:hypothetical protein